MELGTRPAANIAVQTLDAGAEGGELPAHLVRAGCGKMALEWAESASPAVSALLAEAALNSAAGNGERPMPSLGRVRFCALACASGA
jgi:hypothetical protein